MVTSQVFFGAGPERDQLLQFLALLPLVRRTATIIPVLRSNPYKVLAVKNSKRSGWMFAGGGLRHNEPDGVGCLREWGEELPLSSPFMIPDSFRHFAHLHISLRPGVVSEKKAIAFFEGANLPDWVAALLTEVKLPLSVGVDAVFTAMMEDNTPVGGYESEEAEVTAWVDVRDTDPQEFSYFHSDVAELWRQHVVSGYLRYPNPLASYDYYGGRNAS